MLSPPTHTHVLTCWCWKTSNLIQAPFLWKIFSYFPCPDPLCQGHTHCARSGAQFPHSIFHSESRMLELSALSSNSLLIIISLSSALLPYAHISTPFLFFICLLWISNIYGDFGVTRPYAGCQAYKDELHGMLAWLQGIHNQLGKTDDLSR